jgi:PilZ domain-containing protein
MSIEKRRSDRLILTVPLVVTGTDPQGRTFKKDARTIILNRHGALIQISSPLRTGQRIRVFNALCQREAEFSVVGPVAPHTERGGEWAIECVNGQDNIWGIQFPPTSGGTGEPSALLECRKCHNAELKRVSLVEVEVLETAGLLSKPCGTCGGNTPWGYAERILAMSAFTGEAHAFDAPRITRPPDKRRHPRVSLQLPVLVREYYGGVEIAKSENVSKGGFCFQSEKTYHVGAGITAACPYTSAEHSIEVSSRVVRRREIAGSQGKIYGVRYEQSR